MLRAAALDFAENLTITVCGSKVSGAVPFAGAGRGKALERAGSAAVTLDELSTDQPGRDERGR